MGLAIGRQPYGSIKPQKRGDLFEPKIFYTYYYTSLYSNSQGLLSSCPAFAGIKYFLFFYLKN